jgi:hypothetical protein
MRSAAGLTVSIRPRLSMVMMAAIADLRIA